MTHHQSCFRHGIQMQFWGHPIRHRHSERCLRSYWTLTSIAYIQTCFRRLSIRFQLSVLIWRFPRGDRFITAPSDMKAMSARDSRVTQLQQCNLCALMGLCNSEMSRLMLIKLLGTGSRFFSRGSFWGVTTKPRKLRELRNNSVFS
jgi:hypothetical protein